MGEEWLYLTGEVCPALFRGFRMSVALIVPSTVLAC